MFEEGIWLEFFWEVYFSVQISFTMIGYSSYVCLFIMIDMMAKFSVLVEIKHILNLNLSFWRKKIIWTCD